MTSGGPATFPVLREICRIKEQRRGPIDLEPISETLGLPYDQIATAALNLERDGLVGLEHSWGGVTHVKDVSGQALRKVGLWPDAENHADQLLWALERFIDQAANPDESPVTYRDHPHLHQNGSGFATRSPRPAATSPSN